MQRREISSLRTTVAALLLVPLVARAHSESMLFIPLLQIGVVGGAAAGAVAGAFKDKKRLKLLPSLLAALVLLGVAGAVWAQDPRAFLYAVAYGAIACAPPFALFFVLSKELSSRIAGVVRERQASARQTPPPID